MTNRRVFLGGFLLRGWGNPAVRKKQRADARRSPETAAASITFGDLDLDQTTPSLKRIRLAWCITDLDPGGAERALVQIATRLDPTEFEQHVFCLQPAGELAEVLKSAGIPVSSLNLRSRTDLGGIWQLAKALKQFRPDILQTFLFHANVAGGWAGWWAGVQQIFAGIRVAERRSPWYLRLERWSCRRAAAFVCVSQDVARFTTEQGVCSPEKIRVIPNGVEVERFAGATPLDLSPWGITAGDDVWVTVGRIDPQKGPFVLLEAVRKLAPDFPRLRVLWAGEGPLRVELSRAIAEAGLAQQFQLIGYCADVPGLLRAARGFVLASLWEGMPNVVLEAQAAGLPVIASRAEGIQALVTDEVTGLTVPTRDPRALADIWKRCLDAPEWAQTLGDRAREASRQSRGWDHIAARYAALYREQG